MNPFVERVGWTLLHSLWQGALAWIALEIALAVLRNRSANARCIAGCIALALATLLPLITFFRLDLDARLQTPESSTVQFSPLAELAPTGVSAASRSSPTPQATKALAAVDIVRPLLPWLVYAWVGGSAWSWWRLMRGWRCMRRLATVELAAPPAAIVEIFSALCRRMNLRCAVRLAHSALVQTPAVIGWWRPLVLWPAGMATGLSPAQIEALLAHELAHILRHDFAINLLQAVAETLFFYHPAVHAINRHVREAREQACDEIAVALTRDALGYAHALAALETTRTVPLSLAASGDGALLARIRRLLGMPANSPRAIFFLPPALLAALGYLVVLFGAPALTARLMTAHERIAVIQAAAPERAAVFERGDTMFVSGEFRGPDGALLDIDAHLLAISSANNGRTGYGIGVRRGRFAGEISAGELSINAWTHGFAPVFAGPFLPDPKTRSIAPITLTLLRGFPARLRLVDPSGQPLSAVRLAGTICSAAGGTAVSKPSLSLVSDDQGEVWFENVDAQTVIDLASAKSGFQDDTKTFARLAPDQPMIWQLRRAAPTMGRIVDDATGEPIAGVKIQLASRQQGHVSSSPDRDDHVLATTAADGRFTLDTLNSAWNYRVYLKSAEHALAVETITAGAKEEFRLQRGFRLGGVVRGLPRGDATLRCGYSVALHHTSGAGGERVLLLPGDARDRPFTFDHLPAANYRLSLGPHELQVDLRANRPDLQFDLGAQPASRSKRRVVIHLNSPTPEAPPAGALEATLKVAERADRPVARTAEVRIPINNGIASMDAIAPDKIDLSASHLIGYWFDPRSIDVPAGSEPLEVTLDLLPAGAIRGRLLQADGSLAHHALIRCVTDRAETPISASANVNHADGTFIATPLPLGHRYVVIAQSGLNFTVSSPILVDAREPFPSIELARVPGVTIEGRVVDRFGRPVAGAGLDFRYENGSAPHQFVWAPGGTTRPDGSFSLSDINFDVPGRYRIHVYPGEPHQPIAASIELTRATPLPLAIKLER